MATWEQSMQESEEKGLAGEGVPEDTLKVLTLVCLQLLQRPQHRPREATPRSSETVAERLESTFSREGSHLG